MKHKKLLERVLAASISIALSFASIGVANAEELNNPPTPLDDVLNAQENLGVDLSVANVVSQNEDSVSFESDLGDITVNQKSDGVEIGFQGTSGNAASGLVALDFDNADFVDVDDGVTVLDNDGESLVVQPQEDGSVRVQTVIETPESLHHFTYELNLEESDFPLLREDGSVEIYRTFEGEETAHLISYIETPWAVDANGNKVSTSYVLDGNKLIQTVSPDETTAYPIVADPFWVPAIVAGIRVGVHVVIKVGSRVVKYLKSPASKVTNALSRYQTLNFRAGSKVIKLDKSGMNHILSRHHPSYWNGTNTKNQTFFNPSMSVNDVRNAVNQALRQHSASIAKSKAVSQTYSGTLSNGMRYTISIYNGRVTQFYPR